MSPQIMRQTILWILTGIFFLCAAIKSIEQSIHIRITLTIATLEMLHYLASVLTQDQPGKVGEGWRGGGGGGCPVLGLFRLACVCLGAALHNKSYFLAWDSHLFNPPVPCCSHTILWSL